ncbi:response regulator transcription factor [Amycolatopsis rhizosphaerae]|uniref:Response regulator transcription factor n=1 Tax=Amycolatopsis rhizosphaerae TaxID=2053003 RepID=A0A558CTQ9_9PSEU|nr:LuxR C-terminal-related transcriptional regulator [Amycolatopsis rhizosphaerae]TVT52135.1 response regulator transcription factor [Amycolatopsis rhizosphaerae]
MNDQTHIQRTLDRLQKVTGLPLAFGGGVHGTARVRLSEFAGSNRGALRGVVLGPGLGLGGRVVSLRRPMILHDYVRSPGISHDYDRYITAEGLRAMVAAPVVVGRTARAVLYGSTRSAEPLGERILQSFVDAARDLEQRFAVEDELARRMAQLEQETRAERVSIPGTSQWERVRQTYAELRVLSRQTGDERLRALADRLAAPPGDGAPRLSERELDVLTCVALGWTNAQIAADLGLGGETVKSYLRSAMRKLRCHTRLEAVVAARRHGLLP